MRRNRLRDQFIYRTRYHFAEAAGEGDGGGSGEGEPQFDPKTAIDELKGTLSTLQKDIGGTKKFGGEISALKKMMSDLTESVKSLKPTDPEPSDDEPDDESEPEPEPRRSPGRPRKVEAKDESKGDTGADAAITALQKQIKDLQGQIKRASEETAAERAARVAAETKQRTLERDRLIIDAATSIGLADDVEREHVIRHFKDSLEYDEEAEGWKYVKGDESMDVEEGVKKHLPKYMQKPKTRNGGSGGGTPTNTNGPSKQQLKENAIQWHASAKKDNRLMARYNKARKDFEAAGGDPAELVDAIATSSS